MAAIAIEAQSAYHSEVDPNQEIKLLTVNREQEKWSRVVQRLEDLRSLRNDWDGLGALAPSTAIVRSAITLTNAFRREKWQAPSAAVATVAGTILFTWEKPHPFLRPGMRYLEIEVSGPEQAELMIVTEDGKATHVDLNQEQNQ
jgi:hypothetical protein